METRTDRLRALIKPGDLHLIFDPGAERCVVWRRTTAGGEALWALPMRNRTVNEGEEHWGHCPAGSYLLGAPSDCHVIPFGDHFTPLFDLDPDGPMHKHGRGGIGIHGGGSGLRDPFAPNQGWVITEGCLRVQNLDNAHLVHAIRTAQAGPRRCFFTRVKG